jgi:hypothetical protein
LNTPKGHQVPPRAARSLAEARAGMRWRVLPGRWALLGFDEPPAPADLSLLRADPGRAAAAEGERAWQLVREGGETTMLVSEDLLAEALVVHPAARAERGLVWIRFELPMEWELVGFLALVTGELAAEGIPLGAVCGYSRDHLFVAERYLEPARRALARLFPSAEAPTAS